MQICDYDNEPDEYQEREMKKPILTISILVSNNLQGIRKCLDSIQDLISKVPSELLLTDTGCTAEVRGVLEKYSDHIIDFPWVKDFAAARNAGLKEAKGQWFMFLDDDEWFENTDEIAEFFLSGECDGYSIACYYQRNYLSFDGTSYKDTSVDRIIKITPQLHYVHRVHEAYVGIEFYRKKQLNSFVHHYGYVFCEQDKAYEKYLRNQELLELECKDYPDDLRIWHQLITNQYSQNNWDKAISYAKEALKHNRDTEYWDVIHLEILHCLEHKQDWSEMSKLCDLWMNKEFYNYETFGVRQYAIKAYWHMKEYEKGGKAFAEALYLYDVYRNNPDFFNENQLMLEKLFWNEFIDEMYAKGFDCVVKASNSSIMEDVMKYDNDDIINRIIQGKENENRIILLDIFGEKITMIKINELIEDIAQETQILWRGQRFIDGSIILKIEEMIQEIYRNIPQLRENGIEFPIEYIEKAIQNMQIAVEKKDAYRLADNLYFEWKEIFTVYKEVTEEMSGER